MTRTRIAAGIGALALAAGSIALVVPATFANSAGDKPAGCAAATCDPLPGTQDPESFDIGTPPTVDGDVDLGGGDAPTAP